VVVAGAGNAGAVESIPDSKWILSVSATDEYDDLADFSSTGVYVDLAAPGVRIQTTDRGGDYARVSGTSYSGPLVAGVAALLLALDPSLDAFDVEAILETTAIDRGPVGWDQKFGHGRIDAGAAAHAVALRKAACGLGFELALILPALAAWRSRRISSRACRSSSR
jgi:subtilisin family serine protease